MSFMKTIIKSKILIGQHSKAHTQKVNFYSIDQQTSSASQRAKTD